jgi:hypothetical protein
MKSEIRMPESAGQRPGSYQPGALPGQRPRSRAPKNNPKRQRRCPISEIIERTMLIPNRATTPFSGVPKDNTACCRQGLGPNSTSVMPGIEMERAFSALAWPVRLPSPLGWYVFSVGSTGDSPVPSGDPPDGTGSGIERKGTVFSQPDIAASAPGGSPGGAGGSPGGSPAPPTVNTYLGWAGMLGAFGAPRFAGQRWPRTLSRNLQTPVPAARREGIHSPVCVILRTQLCVRFIRP